jgi:retinol dehydrogenase-12
VSVAARSPDASRLSGRSFLVTGANSGIGRAMAEALAARGGRVMLAGRSDERMRPVLDGIRHRDPRADVEFLHLDVSDLGAVRHAAATVLASDRPLDALVNNAGVAGTQALSRDGFDLTYATNHIGPFLLTMLLRPALERAPQGRIVNVSSIAHLRAPPIDWALLERRNVARRSGFPDYAVTKLMNVLHAKELARRLTGTRMTTYALHPGGVRSNIWRALPLPSGGGSICSCFPTRRERERSSTAPPHPSSRPCPDATTRRAGRLRAIRSRTIWGWPASSGPERRPPSRRREGSDGARRAGRDYLTPSQYTGPATPS